MDRPEGRPLVGLVLAGGGARGAYEVGVARYLLEELPRELGRDVPIDILCGTSVGAINACFLAAHADEPRARASALGVKWRELEIERILQLSAIEVVGLLRELIGARPKPILGRAPRGGVVDPAGLTSVIADAIPFERIDEHVRAGKIQACSVSTTHVATGRTVVFVDHTPALSPRWGTHPTMDRCQTKLRIEHALASAAIPFVFPAVTIDSDLYCDGGLRQNVPLSPARRLGADRLIVVNPHFIGANVPPPEVAKEREQVFPGPAFLVGKALNALLLDRLDSDVDRLRRINEILAAGTREYGPGFIDSINRQLGLAPGAGIRALETVVIRASLDIGRLSGDHVRSPKFQKRSKGLAGKALSRLASSEGDEADFLSYLVFDGDFAAELMDLGAADARAKKDELVALFDGCL
ncbi:MAG TPA: patatin-like phospholipase family protein [Polyangiaceae bacterium]|nr:patatin-like phospholipase family protein [Polyangiaceae bacterium]